MEFDLGIGIKKLSDGKYLFFNFPDDESCALTTLKLVGHFFENTLDAYFGDDES